MFAADANGEFKANDTYGEKDKAYRFENGKLVFDFNLYNNGNRWRPQRRATEWSWSCRRRLPRYTTARQPQRCYRCVRIHGRYRVQSAGRRKNRRGFVRYGGGGGKINQPPQLADIAVGAERLNLEARVAAHSLRGVNFEPARRNVRILRADGLYLVIEDEDKELKLGDVMYFYLSVKDKAGNVKRNTEGNVDDFTKSEAKVKIISSATTDAYTELTPFTSKIRTISLLTPATDGANVMLRT